MKTIIFLLAMLFVQLFHAQADSATITVVVEDLSSSDGAIIAGLYTEDTFLKAAPQLTGKSGIIDGKATITFDEVPAGTYGISIFHDSNDNKKMDFEPTGMPKEDYGISNNKFNPYGPPEWADAKFEVSGEPLEFNIRLSR